ncbi:MAG TPA: hypothetical protein VND45_02010 [Thermoanaerobaculia bacterium]|nr:hypothetical protein [Thermoanaerobaculia bacterium]
MQCRALALDRGGFGEARRFHRLPHPRLVGLDPGSPPFERRLPIEPMALDVREDAIALGLRVQYGPKPFQQRFVPSAPPVAFLGDAQQSPSRNDDSNDGGDCDTDGNTQTYEHTILRLCEYKTPMTPKCGGDRCISRARSWYDEHTDFWPHCCASIIIAGSSSSRRTNGPQEWNRQSRECDRACAARERRSRKPCRARTRARSA